MKKTLCIASIIFTTLILHIKAQEGGLYDIRSATDCNSAIEISTTKPFGPTTAPASQEVDEKTGYFEKVTHQVWYKFIAEKDGKMTFDIVPIDPSDNYDFILFKADKNICKTIKTKKIQPLRANFARCNPAIEGKTGLAILEGSDFDNNDPTQSYCKAISVKKGEEYYLALNNIYQLGKGHYIYFKYLKTFAVTGKVLDQTNLPVANAEVNWENMRTEKLMAHTKTDAKGNYDIELCIEDEPYQFPTYCLSVYNPAYFIADTLIKSSDIEHFKNKKLDFTLPKIKAGINSEILPPIFFAPNKPIIESESNIVIERIVKLMHKNKQLEIELGGHTNGYYPSTDIDQRLSENRAVRVREELISNGVDPTRIVVKGYGSTELIYPKAKNEEEEGANRRVVIKILKF